MATSTVWSDFEAVRHGITSNTTVDKLKQILTGLNDCLGLHLAKTGKKQDIIERIVYHLEAWRSANQDDKWSKAKAVIEQVRNTGMYTGVRGASYQPLPGSALQSHSTFSVVDGAKPLYNNPTLGSSASTSTYDPYGPPKKLAAPSNPAASGSGSRPIGIRFKESPFFTIDQAVSNVVECPESTSAQDRRSQHLAFSLTPDQIAKLKTGGNYQLRLFCTSSVFYGGPNSFRSNTLPCPIEFPPTCEVRVNNTQVMANLKGLKKKPGTAPPPDINKYVRISNIQNRVEMVYVNAQQPIPSKKFYMVVMLVEGKSIDSLVQNLRDNQFVKAEEIQAKMAQSVNDDDDIIAGPQKMSLRCPLTFMRINTPCRSSKCVHPQCFDASSWFTMMEQTTTWLCPVCERVLEPRDLIIDGYFDNILRDTPDDVEDIIVEADGEWHTSDNKFASAKWRAKHPPAQPAAVKAEVEPVLLPPGAGKGKAPSHEVFCIESDDEDEDIGRVKSELSPSYASSANLSFEGTIPATSQRSTASSSVIDLTLDSDSDDEPLAPPPSRPPPPPVPSAPKRSATEAEILPPPDQLWKKGRLEDSRILPPPSRTTGIGLGQTQASNGMVSTLSQGGRYSNTLPGLPSFPSFRSSTSGTLQLPPLANPPYSRTNGTSSTNNRWQ